MRPKSSLTEPKLNAKQQTFVDVVAMGGSDVSAIRAYNPDYDTTQARQMAGSEKVQQAITRAKGKNAYMLGLSREDVLQGMMDAVSDAKMIADPMAQIAGWREIAKVCGFYAPEVKKLELTGSAKRVADRMQALSDEELLQIANAEDIDFVETPRGN